LIARRCLSQAPLQHFELEGSALATYSARNTIIGSTRLALRAGIQQARSATKTVIGFMNTFMAIRAQALGHHIKPVGPDWSRNSSSNKANTARLAATMRWRISERKFLSFAVPTIKRVSLKR